MTVDIQDRGKGLLVMRVSDQLAIADRTKWEIEMKKAMELEGSVRTLIIIDKDFKGWQPSNLWGDVTFMTEHGDGIKRMAIVGNPKWREEALAFVGDGYRATEIKYFGPEAELDALEWVVS